MAITYSLAPNPKWYISDLVGRPLAGGYLATFSSLDNTQLKPVFQDPAGQFAWPYVNIPNNLGKLGILFDENGAQGPFYFEFDDSLPDDLYYLEVYDSSGVLQWTIDDFSGGGSGGGSVITTAIDLENLVVNNVMWRNTGSSASPIDTLNLKLAPGAHAALANNVTNTGGFYTGPDIYFLKNTLSATDAITFPLFTLGDTPLTGDVTPVDYMRYQCTNSPAGETFKVAQFPITRSVQNLSNQNVTVTIWARSVGVNSITMQFMQFFGDGASGSPTVITPIQTVVLSSAWTKYNFQTTIPSVSGKTLGECGNDALFLQVLYPLGVSCQIDITKPSIYLGNISPAQDYHTYDMIDGVINAQRSGYITSGFDTAAPPGYVIMNDGTIGSATSSATTRANVDTFPLYNILWNNVIDMWAPVVGGRGANAISDFAANKPITLTRQLGRLLGSAGAGMGLTARVLGQYLGTETISIPDMPGHTHTAGNGGAFVTDQTGSPSVMAGTTGGNQTTGDTASTGGSGADGKMPPSSFMNFFIKL